MDDQILSCKDFKAWTGDLIYNNTFKATDAKFKAFYYWYLSRLRRSHKFFK